MLKRFLSRLLPKPKTAVDEFVKRLGKVKETPVTLDDMYLTVEALRALTFNDLHKRDMYGIAAVTRVTTVDNLIIALNSHLVSATERSIPNVTGIMRASKLRLLVDILVTNDGFTMPPSDSSTIVADRLEELLRVLDHMFLVANDSTESFKLRDAEKLVRRYEHLFREVLQFTRMVIELSDQTDVRRKPGS